MSSSSSSSSGAVSYSKVTEKIAGLDLKQARSQRRNQVQKLGAAIDNDTALVYYRAVFTGARVPSSRVDWPSRVQHHLNAAYRASLLAVERQLFEPMAYLLFEAPSLLEALLFYPEEQQQLTELAEYVARVPPVIRLLVSDNATKSATLREFASTAGINVVNEVASLAFNGMWVLMYAPLENIHDFLGIEFTDQQASQAQIETIQRSLATAWTVFPMPPMSACLSRDAATLLWTVLQPLLHSAQSADTVTETLLRAEPSMGRNVLFYAVVTRAASVGAVLDVLERALRQAQPDYARRTAAVAASMIDVGGLTPLDLAIECARADSVQALFDNFFVRPNQQQPDAASIRLIARQFWNSYYSPAAAAAAAAVPQINVPAVKRRLVPSTAAASEGRTSVGGDGDDDSGGLKRDKAQIASREHPVMRCIRLRQPLPMLRTLIDAFGIDDTALLATVGDEQLTYVQYAQRVGFQLQPAPPAPAAPAVSEEQRIAATVASDEFKRWFADNITTNYQGSDAEDRGYGGLTLAALDARWLPYVVADYDNDRLFARRFDGWLRQQDAEWFKRQRRALRYKELSAESTYDELARTLPGQQMADLVDIVDEGIQFDDWLARQTPQWLQKLGLSAPITGIYDVDQQLAKMSAVLRADARQQILQEHMKYKRAQSGSAAQVADQRFERVVAGLKPDEDSDDDDDSDFDPDAPEAAMDIDKGDGGARKKPAVVPLGELRKQAQVQQNLFNSEARSAVVTLWQQRADLATALQKARVELDLSGRTRADLEKLEALVRENPGKYQNDVDGHPTDMNILPLYALQALITLKRKMRNEALLVENAADKGPAVASDDDEEDDDEDDDEDSDMSDGSDDDDDRPLVARPPAAPVRPQRPEAAAAEPSEADLKVDADGLIKGIRAALDRMPASSDKAKVEQAKQTLRALSDRLGADNATAALALLDLAKKSRPAAAAKLTPTAQFLVRNAFPLGAKLAAVAAESSKDMPPPPPVSDEQPGVSRLELRIGFLLRNNGDDDDGRGSTIGVKVTGGAELRLSIRTDNVPPRIVVSVSDYVSETAARGSGSVGVGELYGLSVPTLIRLLQAKQATIAKATVLGTRGLLPTDSGGFARIVLTSDSVDLHREFQVPNAEPAAAAAASVSLPQSSSSSAVVGSSQVDIDMYDDYDDDDDPRSQQQQSSSSSAAAAASGGSVRTNKAKAKAPKQPVLGADGLLKGIKTALGRIPPLPRGSSSMYSSMYSQMYENITEARAKLEAVVGGLTLEERRRVMALLETEKNERLDLVRVMTLPMQLAIVRAFPAPPKESALIETSSPRQLPKQAPLVDVADAAEMERDDDIVILPPKPKHQQPAGFHFSNSDNQALLEEAAPFDVVRQQQQLQQPQQPKLVTGIESLFDAVKDYGYTDQDGQSVEVNGLPVSDEHADLMFERQLARYTDRLDATFVSLLRAVRALQERDDLRTQADIAAEQLRLYAVVTAAPVDVQRTLVELVRTGRPAVAKKRESGLYSNLKQLRSGLPLDADAADIAQAASSRLLVLETQRQSLGQQASDLVATIIRSRPRFVAGVGDDDSEFERARSEIEKLPAAIQYRIMALNTHIAWRIFNDDGHAEMLREAAMALLGKNYPGTEAGRDFERALQLFESDLNRGVGVGYDTRKTLLRIGDPTAKPAALKLLDALPFEMKLLVTVIGRHFDYLRTPKLFGIAAPPPPSQSSSSSSFRSVLSSLSSSTMDDAL